MHNLLKALIKIGDNRTFLYIFVLDYMYIIHILM